MKLPRIALQLYTVRDRLKQDYLGTLKQVVAIGYKAVEVGASGDCEKDKQTRKTLEDLGLGITSMMVGIEALEKDLGKAAEEAAIFGVTHMIIPYVHDDRRKDAAGWKQTAANLDRIGADLRRRGLTLAYHNHSFEFQKFDGQCGLDILYGSSDPRHLAAELDVYWVKHGGEDPVTYIDRYANRTPLLHLKDMAAGPERKFAPVGTGIIDLKGVLEAGARACAIWGIIEQDNCYDIPSIEAARISLENCVKLGATA